MRSVDCSVFVLQAITKTSIYETRSNQPEGRHSFETSFKMLQGMESRSLFRVFMYGSGGFFAASQPCKWFSGTKWQLKCFICDGNAAFKHTQCSAWVLHKKKVWDARRCKRIACYWSSTQSPLNLIWGQGLLYAFIYAFNKFIWTPNSVFIYTYNSQVGDSEQPTIFKNSLESPHLLYIPISIYYSGCIHTTPLIQLLDEAIFIQYAESWTNQTSWGSHPFKT